MLGSGIVKRIRSFGEEEERVEEQNRVIREFTVDEITESMIWFEVPSTDSGESTMTYPSPIDHPTYDEDVKELVEEIIDCDGERALYRIELVKSGSSDFSWPINEGECIGEVRE